MMSIKKRAYNALNSTLLGRRLLALNKMRAKIKRNGSYYTRSFFFDPDKKLLYLSVSKAGNTSIKACLYAMPEMDDYRNVHNAVHHQKNRAQILQISRFSDYYKFTFVRNPFDRLVSCYENKLHSDRESVGVTINELIYDRYLMGYLGKDRGFMDFARRVCRIPDKYADRHFVSQSFGMLDENGRLIPDYVGKFENFAGDFEVIREKFDLAPLPHYNQTKKEKKNWMDYYDLDTARRVYERYKTDIQVFGYQQTYDELVAYIKSKGN